MKHLLILLISILLLSSPLFGHSKGEHTLYKWDNSSGDGFVWKSFGDKETQPVYKGEVDESGNPNGYGILIYLYGIKYVGSWKDGLENGWGNLVWSDGRNFKGEFRNGIKWNGTLRNKNGESIEKYVNGKYIPQ